MIVNRGSATVLVPLLAVMALLLVGTPAYAYPGDTDWTRLVNVHSGKCLEVADSRMDDGASVQQWSCVPGLKSQVWLWIQKEDHGNYGRDYKIINVHSGKCLEVADSATHNGARLQQWQCVDHAPGQLWRLPYIDHPPNPRRTWIFSPHSGKCLEIPDGRTSNGVRAQQWECDGPLPRHMVWDY